MLPIATDATSFTSFRVIDQIKEAHYIVRGRVGKMEVREEPTTTRPYTYWEFSIIEVYSDDKLQNRIDIRQPGGEIVGSGYYVSASAKFEESEEVIVMQRDTQEEAKEIIGLASGKYTVMKDDKGNEYLQSGLGFPLKDANAKWMSPNEFAQLVDRVLSQDTTESDQSIRASPSAHASHFQPPGVGFPAYINAMTPQKPKPMPTAAAVKKSDLSLKKQKKQIESIAAKSDRNLASESDVNWIQVIAIITSFLLIAWISFLVLRPTE